MSPEQAYHLLDLPPEELQKQCKINYFQASGAGGQKRNRKLSAVRLIHSGSAISATASDLRETAQNLKHALHRLRLEIALSPSPEDLGNPDIPILASRFRVSASDEHPDFPPSALTALHLFFRENGAIGETAAKLNCSGAALIKFLKKNKTLWRKAQAIRQHFNHPPLK